MTSHVKTTHVLCKVWSTLTLWNTTLFEILLVCGLVKFHIYHWKCTLPRTSLGIGDVIFTHTSALARVSMVVAALISAVDVSQSVLGSISFVWAIGEANVVLERSSGASPFGPSWSLDHGSTGTGGFVANLNIVHTRIIIPGRNILILISSHNFAILLFKHEWNHLIIRWQSSISLLCIIFSFIIGKPAVVLVTDDV